MRALVGSGEGFLVHRQIAVSHVPSVVGGCWRSLSASLRIRPTGPPPAPAAPKVPTSKYHLLELGLKPMSFGGTPTPAWSLYHPDCFETPEHSPGGVPWAVSGCFLGRGPVRCRQAFAVADALGALAASHLMQHGQCQSTVEKWDLGLQ